MELISDFFVLSGIYFWLIYLGKFFISLHRFLNPRCDTVGEKEGELQKASHSEETPYDLLGTYIVASSTKTL